MGHQQTQQREGTPKYISLSFSRNFIIDFSSVRSRLIHPQAVANSRQFPFAFFSAYEAINIDIQKLKEEVQKVKQEAKNNQGKKPKPKLVMDENGRMKKMKVSLSLSSLWCCI
jgi:hypothetical protein